MPSIQGDFFLTAKPTTCSGIPATSALPNAANDVFASSVNQSFAWHSLKMEVNVVETPNFSGQAWRGRRPSWSVREHDHGSSSSSSYTENKTTNKRRLGVGTNFAVTSDTFDKKTHTATCLIDAGEVEAAVTMPSSPPLMRPMVRMARTVGVGLRSGGAASVGGHEAGEGEEGEGKWEGWDGEDDIEDAKLLWTCGGSQRKQRLDKYMAGLSLGRTVPEKLVGTGIQVGTILCLCRGSWVVGRHTSAEIKSRGVFIVLRASSAELRRWRGMKHNA